MAVEVLSVVAVALPSSSSTNKDLVRTLSLSDPTECINSYTTTPTTTFVTSNNNGNDQGLDNNYFSTVNIDEPTGFSLGGNADDSASAAAALQSLEAVQAQLPSSTISAHSLPVHCNRIKTLAVQSTLNRATSPIQNG